MNQDVVNWPYILTDVWFKRSRACSIASIKTWNPFQTFLFLVSNFQSAKSMMLKTDDADSYIFIWYWNMSQMPLLFDPLIHTKKTFWFFSVDQKVTVENNIKLLKSLEMSQWPFLLFFKKKRSCTTANWIFRFGILSCNQTDLCKTYCFVYCYFSKIALRPFWNRNRAQFFFHAQIDEILDFLVQGHVYWDNPLIAI